MRWHWTKDPENGERVSQHTYAKSVGKAQQTISIYVRAYEMWLRDQSRSVLECLRKVKTPKDLPYPREKL